jgi:hypothetical protein
MKDQDRPVVTREDIAEAERARGPRADVIEDEPVQEETPEASQAPEAAPAKAADARTNGEHARLFEQDRSSELQRRWTDVQARFVDDPKAAVKSADALVDEVIRDLSTLFSDERSKLEGQWDRDADVSTEDLRVAIRRYRAFFERLLSI